jgi:predicted AlkP superfamily phosphohydrolase/phosphomutase
VSGRRRLLMVSFEALAGNLAPSLVRGGRLPTLANLAERGVFVPLSTVGEHMPESSWASMVTGTRPGRNGIYNWRIVKPGSRERTRLPSGGWVRPFWAAFGTDDPGSDRKLVLLDVPYAAHLGNENVTEVFGWGSRVTRIGSSWPPELFEDVARRHAPHPSWLNRDYDRGPLSERRYRRVLRQLTRRRTDLALELLGRREWDCAVINYTEPHYAAHAFHHHLDAVEAPRRRSRLGAVTGYADICAETDHALARLLEAAGPQTDVLVFSTLGLRPNECSKDLLGRVLTSLGYQYPAARAAAGWKQAGASLATTVLPRGIRHRVRSLIPDGMVEAVDDAAWGREFDWSRSRAVSEAEQGSAWLRFNIAGREPDGIVMPEDVDALRAAITADLESLTDPLTGEPAVAEVLTAAEVAPGPLTAQMPDLLVRWTPNTRIRRVRHPRVGLIDDGGGPYARTEHDGRGFLVAAGPGIAAGQAANGEGVAREIDLAPTALQLLGLPIPEAMEGRPLRWLMANDREPWVEAIDLAVEPSF